MSLETWKAAIEEIPQIIAGEPTADRAILLASLYSLRDRLDSLDAQGQAVPVGTAEIPTGDTEAVSSDDAEWLLSTASEELSDANMYYEKWTSTGIAGYKEIALAEMRHFEMLIKIMRDSGMVADVQELMLIHNALLARLA